LNLLAQLRIGLYLEHKWGWMRLVTIYFTAGIGGKKFHAGHFVILAAGSLTSLVLRPNVVSVGASAALLGLIGAYLAEVLCCRMSCGH
jgi:membrane associated rhomboid family serine protease